MEVKQISVFLENKTGRINDVAQILGEQGINMLAFSMAETADFGILRMIVTDVKKAQEVLKAAHFAVNLTDVICLHCGNVPGALSAVLDILAKAEVFIEYMYAFSEGETARIVIRPTNIAKCAEILDKNGYSMVLEDIHS